MADYQDAPPAERLNPPSWTEWTKNPNERSRQRLVFDQIMSELRPIGMVDAKSSIFMQLCQYCYLTSRNARIEVRRFQDSIPELILNAIPPTQRLNEINATLRMLAEAGLCKIVVESGGNVLQVILTERLEASQRALSKATQMTKALLSRFYDRTDFQKMLSQPVSFPSWESLDNFARKEGFEIVPKATCPVIEDHPELNEDSPRPFVQQTLRSSETPFVIVSFWPIPDGKAVDRSQPLAVRTGPGLPEFSILMPADLEISNLVSFFCVPIIQEFLQADENREITAEIQIKFVDYLRKYNERFRTGGANPTVNSDRIERVLSKTDSSEDTFANAVYVLVQILSLIRSKNLTNAKYQKIIGNPILYQATRICYAHTMAQRVLKRQVERTAAARVNDAKVLVDRLKVASVPLPLEDLRNTLDWTRKMQIGRKYDSVLELLPLTSDKEGVPAEVYEINGEFIHKENLLMTFQALRAKEVAEQKDRLAHAWAVAGVPKPKDFRLDDADISPLFARITDLVFNNRVISRDPLEFAKHFLPSSRTEYALVYLGNAFAQAGKRMPVTTLEVITRGLDVLLFTDRNNVKRNPYHEILGMADHYREIAKAAWDIVFYSDGFILFVMRKFLGWFRGGGSKPAKAKAPRKGSKAPSAGKGGKPGKGGGKPSGGSKESREAEDDSEREERPANQGAAAAGRKQADLKKLKSIAPAAENRSTLAKEIQVTLDQWCFKIDKKDQEKTQRSVDHEIARLIGRVPLDEFSEENAVKLALWLTKQSTLLAQIVNSRAYTRYLYLTALSQKLDKLER